MKAENWQFGRGEVRETRVILVPRAISSTIFKMRGSKCPAILRSGEKPGEEVGACVFRSSPTVVRALPVYT